jgi:hypothetical protein
MMRVAAATSLLTLSASHLRTSSCTSWACGEERQMRRGRERRGE